MIVFKLLTGVWCDARTDVVGDLETYNPVWRDILPKLLHANPAGRECPDWRELEKARREDEAYKAERAFDELRAKRHDAVRGRRNGWVAATLAALLAAILACFVQRMTIPPPVVSPPDFDSIVRIPPNAPEEDPEDENGMPSRSQLEKARIDAWVLTHDIFSDLKAGKVASEKVVSDLQHLIYKLKGNDLTLFSSKGGETYVQVGETTAPLIYLLQTSISNLTMQAEKK